MFGGSAYDFVIINYFFFAFFLFIPFATQLFSTPVTSSNLRKKLRNLRSSAFYRQPKLIATLILYCQKQLTYITRTGHIFTKVSNFTW